MAIISGSIFLMVKGVIFIAKSAALKAAVVKYGGYLLTTKGIAATVATASTVAGVAGIVAIADDTAKHTVTGFEKMRDGILEESPSKFFDGLTHLHRAYKSATDLLEDFSNYLNDSIPDVNTRNVVKEGINEFKSFVVDEIEHNCVALIAEVEYYLKRSNISYDNYKTEIEHIYRQHLCCKPINDYKYLLGQAGKVYDDIVHYNMRFGINGNNTEFDHFLVYCIAGWIKDNMQSFLVINKSQKELAGDITDNIINYLNTRKDETIFSDRFTNNPDDYDDNILLIYKYYFTNDIFSYDALLSRAGKVYDDLCRYNFRMGKWLDRNKFDHVVVYYMAGWIKSNTNYPFVQDKEQARIAADITNQIMNYVRNF